MKKSELIELLKRSHEALEAVTDRVGCDFRTAVVLTDCENAINEINQTGQQAETVRGLSIVH